MLNSVLLRGPGISSVDYGVTGRTESQLLLLAVRMLGSFWHALANFKCSELTSGISFTVVVQWQHTAFQIKYSLCEKIVAESMEIVAAGRPTSRILH